MRHSLDLWRWPPQGVPWPERALLTLEEWEGA